MSNAEIMAQLDSWFAFGGKLLAQLFFWDTSSREVLIQLVFWFVVFVFFCLVYEKYWEHQNSASPAYKKNPLWRQNLRRFSGLEFVLDKFVPKDGGFPTGFVWLVGIYFAIFAVTSQRYENKVDQQEYKFNIFTTQLSAGVPFDNKRLLSILNTEIPKKADFLEPWNVISSFCFPLISDGFYTTFRDPNGNFYDTVAKVNGEIIRQWSPKLENLYLFDVNLKEADLREAHLKGAYLPWANLKGADLSLAHLEGADLSSANLKGADLIAARLEGADLSRADLNGADLLWANLEGATGLTAEALIRAKSLYRIQNYPEYLLEGIKSYGCVEMIDRRPSDWSEEFTARRTALIKKWDEEEKQNAE
jgi:hypothetical protein